MNIPNQEWRNNTRNELSSSKRQIRDEILNGNYEGHDAQKVLDAIIITKIKNLHLVQLNRKRFICYT